MAIIISRQETMFCYLTNLLCSTYGGDETYWALVVKPEGKRPLGRPRRRWEDNIKMDIQGLGWAGMNRMDLAQNRNMRRASVNSRLPEHMLASQEELCSIVLVI
jgi:hypothetical protein